MDFSKFSTKDLEYLKAQKLDKVSTNGLTELQRQLSGVPSDTSDKSVPYDLLMSPAEWEKTNAGATIQRERPAEPTVQKPQTTLDQIPILREAVGGFDAAVAAASPIVTAPVGAYYGLGRQAVGAVTGNQYAPSAEEAVMKGMEATAYRPQTEIGQKAMEGLGSFLETSKLAPTPTMGVVPQKIPAKTLFGADPRSLEFNAVPIKLPLTKNPMYVVSKLLSAITQPVFWLSVWWLLALVLLPRFKRMATSMLWGGMLVLGLLGFSAVQSFNFDAK
jgi:hypothetical protein